MQNPGKLPGVVKINGKNYVVATIGDSLAFSSGQRSIQGVPTDDFRLPIEIGGRGAGRSHYNAQNMFTTIPDTLLPPPAKTTLTMTSGGTGLFTTPLRGDFEEQDSNGRWYKYLWGPRAIVKIDITSNPPVVRQIYDLTVSTVSAFATTDRVGQPIRLTSSGVNYWYLPCNSGDRVVKLTTPVGIETTSVAYAPVVTLNGAITAAATSLVYTSAGDPIAAGDILLIDTEEIRVGAIDTGTNTCSVLYRGWAGTTAATHSDTAAITKKGGNDVFTAITSIVKGAAHFEGTPDGRVERATSSHSAGTAQNRAEISILVAGANPDTDANWGQDFPVGNQTRWITALLAYGNMVLIHKQDGWYAATILSDGTMNFESVLPDDQFVEATALGAETTHRGAVWHGQAILPAGSLWRSIITSALPVGPDNIEGYETTDINQVADPVRFGRIPVVVGVNSWIYAPYPMAYSNSYYLLAGRQNAEGTIDWYEMYGPDGTASDTGAQYVGLQVNGVGAPRIFYAIDTSIYHFVVAQDGNPAVLDGYQSWDSRLNGAWVSNPILFPCKVLLREMEYVIEHANANLKWGLKVYRDGGTAETVLAASSGKTASASIFWTARTNDTCRRLRVEITNNGGALASVNSPSAFRAAILYGTYLPNVSDALVFVIDCAKTATLRGTSQKAIYDELKALSSGGAKTWIDPYQQSGEISVSDVKEGAPKDFRPLRGRPYMTVNAVLQKYS